MMSKWVSTVFGPLGLAAAAACLVLAGCGSGQIDPPDAEIQVVTDVYHGVEVTDPYRWLEDFSDPEVREWSDAQNRHARAILDALPDRAAIHNRLEELYQGASSQYYYLCYRGGRLFAMKDQPPAEQPLLVVMESVGDVESERVLLDLNKLDPEALTSLDFYEPSWDGRLVAVSLSKQGSELGDVHVYDVATGDELADVVPRVNGPTAGGHVAWKADNSGFFYTRYPRPGERADEDLSFYQQVYYHELGTATEEDSYAIGSEFPRIAETWFSTSDDGRHIVANVANGDGGEYAHYLLTGNGRWIQVTEFQDKIKRVALSPSGHLYLLSRMGAPRGQILRLPLDKPVLGNAVVAVPESEVVIKSFLPTKSRLYVIDMDGGPSRLRVFDHKGRAKGTIPVQPVSSVWGMLCVGGDDILFTNTSYLEPPAWYRYHAASGETVRTAMALTSPADFGDAEVIRETATSKDGTPVPLNIIMRKGTELTGNNPTILTGYGGFGISLTPSFSASRRLWLDQGGICVVANLRGGGEFGEEWHLAGNLTNKQNVFDDFIACAEYLIEKGYTSPSHLAIEGGSNGGLLTGAAMTQQPDLFQAVVAHVGIYDMVRYEKDPNGVFNITEYGTTEDKEQFEAIYAYSPYHNVEDGIPYPAALFTTGENDGRVNPAHSRKMVAKLRAASSSSEDILLRTSSVTGHGGGTPRSRQIDKEADTYAFIVSRLGMRYGHGEPGDR